jgi:hypothetical protein
MKIPIGEKQKFVLSVLIAGFNLSSVHSPGNLKKSLHEKLDMEYFHRYFISVSFKIVKD